MQFLNWALMLLRKTVPFSSPSGSRGGAYAIRPYNRVRVALQKTVSFSSPSGPRDGRIQYAPTIGYMRSFEIPMRSPDWVRARVQKMDLYTPPTVAYGGTYSIRPYNWVRAIFRNTDAIPQPGTCEGSKNGSVFVPFGAARWAYSIRPYNWVRAILRNTDAISQPGTCGLSKNSPVFVPYGAAGWGVFNTPLQSGTCDSSKYQCNFSIGYLCSFKNCLIPVPFGAAWWAYAICPYNRVRVILRNTDAIS